MTSSDAGRCNASRFACALFRQMWPHSYHARAGCSSPDWVLHARYTRVRLLDMKLRSLAMDNTRLLERLYGSLSDENSFRQFMHSLAATFRSHLVATQMDDVRHQHHPLMHYDSDGCRCADLDARYVSTEIQNPWFAAEAAVRLRACGTLSDNGIVSANELRLTDFYAHVLRPLDVFHSIGFLLDQTDDGVSFLSVSRSARMGPYTEREERLACHLLPHLRNLGAIQRSLMNHRVPVSGDEDFVATLDGEGRLVEVITSGNSTLSTLFFVRDQRIMPAHFRDRHAWQDELSAIASNRHLEGAIPIFDSRGNYAATARLNRLPPYHHLSWMLRAAPMFLLTVRCRRLATDHVDWLLRRLFKLTAAEVRVAMELHEVERLSDVATRLGRSEETVRSQLKAVFGKTGVNSQVQLMRLLDRLAG